MSLVLPREEEVENIFSRILSSNESCERLLETFYDHLCDDNRFMDPDPHHFAEVLLPIREFESTMLHHLGVIDGLVLSCREKMIKTADSDRAFRYCT